MPTTVTLSGWKEFEAKLKKLPKELQGEVDGEVENAGRLWAAKAKQDAPVDVGTLAGGISSVMVSGVAEVSSNANYSAFIEWGTRGRASVPADLQVYAAQFKGAAGVGKAKEFIYEWCRRKGIPKEAWYLIYRSIMTNGIRPHPFFFIQIPIVEKQLFANVQKILNTEH